MAEETKPVGWRLSTLAEIGTVIAVTAGGIVYLWHLADDLHIANAHAGAVQSVAYSPDGKLLITHGTDRKFRLWDSRSGELLWTQGHDDEVTALALSPDGKLIASASGTTVQLWDLARRVLRCTLKQKGKATAIAFSSDSRLLFASGESLFAISEIRDGRPRSHLEDPRGPEIIAVTGSPKGDLIAVAESDGRVVVRDLGLKETIATFATARSAMDAAPITSLCFNPGGSLLACGSGQPPESLSYDRQQQEVIPTIPQGWFAQVHVWDISTGRQHWTELFSGEGPVRAVTFSPNAKWLAVGGQSSHLGYDPFKSECVAGGIVRILDTATGKTLHERSLARNVIQALAFRPDGQRLAMGTASGTLIVQPVSGGIDPVPCVFVTLYAPLAALALILWIALNRKGPTPRLPDAELEAARTWGFQYVREKYAAHAALIEPHYSPPDLEADLRRHITGAKTVPQVHDRAKVLAERIDRFRAYESVRATYRAEVETVGAQLSYDAISADVEALLDPTLRMAHVRSRELELISRIKQLGRFYRERSDSADEGAEPVRSLDDLAVAIEREVRAEAQPEHTEEDVQREIAHRRRRLSESPG